MMPSLRGERSGGKRGRVAQGHTPFVAAVETNDEGHPLRMKHTVVEGIHVSDVAALAHQYLGAGTRVVSGGLACFGSVTAAACANEPVVVGSANTAVERPEFRCRRRFSATSRAPCAASTTRFGPSMLSAISRSSSTDTIVISTRP